MVHGEVAGGLEGLKGVMQLTVGLERDVVGKEEEGDEKHASLQLASTANPVWAIPDCVIM